jgi:hypothetical protein
MKAFFEIMIQAYYGTYDGLVYYYNPRLRSIIDRPYVKHRKTTQNDLFKTISAQLKTLAPSEGYKRDLAMQSVFHCL